MPEDEQVESAMGLKMSNLSSIYDVLSFLCI